MKSVNGGFYQRHFRTLLFAARIYFSKPKPARASPSLISVSATFCVAYTRGKATLWYHLIYLFLYLFFCL